MQERRTLTNYIEKDDIPSSAVPYNSNTSVRGNVFYIPMYAISHAQIAPQIYIRFNYNGNYYIHGRLKQINGVTLVDEMYSGIMSGTYIQNNVLNRYAHSATTPNGVTVNLVETFGVYDHNTYSTNYYYKPVQSFILYCDNGNNSTIISDGHLQDLPNLIVKLPEEGDSKPYAVIKFTSDDGGLYYIDSVVNQSYLSSYDPIYIDTE